jgi:hypothetical protein
VARDHTAASLALEVLEALCAAEPGGVISREPALRDAVAPLLNRVSQLTSFLGCGRESTKHIRSQ